MMASPKDRKEFFALLQSVNEGNRSYYSRFGKWIHPLLKVYWVEVNDKYYSQVLQKANVKAIGRELFELMSDDEQYWVDTADKRIWQIFTFAKTKDATRVIQKMITNQVGADCTWLTERFMQRIVKDKDYNDRGFGIQFKDILSSEQPESDFSAKFWVGKASASEYSDFLNIARKNFTIANIRFGKNESRDGKGLSGQLYELYYDGHITVNTCDETEEMVDLFSFIREIYKKEILSLEKERKQHPMAIEVNFSRKIDLDGFQAATFTGEGQMRLWLQRYNNEEGMTRFCGVDRHTGDFIQLDMAEDYSFLSASPGSCMNVVPRYGTNAARFLSSNVKISHEGIELFA